MDEIQRYYDKGYKSFDRLYHKLLSKGLSIKRADVRGLIDSNSIRSRVRKYNKALMGNKFSSVPDAYQMDTYFTEKYKTPYLLLININTRFAWCKKRDSLTSDDFTRNIKEFIDELHPNIIECDEEPSFVAYKSVEFLRVNNVILKVFVSTNGHERLCMVNSFSRTLRVYSRDCKGDPDVPAIVKRYNKSYHSSIRMEPREMQNNVAYERRYIYDQLYKFDSKKKLALDDPIERHDKVRYIRDSDRRDKRFAKDIMKNQLSKYYYKVESKHDLSYNIIAADGSIKTVPRYKLYKLTPTEERVMEFAPTVEDENNLEIFDEIVDYRPHFRRDGAIDRNKTDYIVRVISRDRYGNKLKKQARYKIGQVRYETPTVPSKLEIEFLDRNKDRFRIDKASGYLVPI